jgi:acetylornithine deacetylase
VSRNCLSLNELRDAVNAVRELAGRFLCELIRFPSTPGNEAGALEFAAGRFAELMGVERVPLSNSLRLDEDYSEIIPGLDYEGRVNLRLCLPGGNAGRSLLFNSHIDVVPASEGQDHAFDPRVDGGVVRGRGACDAKGQIATLFAVFLAMKRLVVMPRGTVRAHLVVEEENGGNGSLAMVRRGECADACIVMEPTELRILPSVRGTVWFRVRCAGRPGHPGRPSDTVSALKMVVRVMELLELYHARLLAESSGIPLFDRFPNPMPITFGKLVAGDWPAMAPARAVLEGVLGILPNKTRYEVMREMRRILMECGDTWLRDHFEIEFPCRHDAHVLASDHPLVAALQACCQEADEPGEISAFPAAADSWLYNNQLRVPTVLFGPGSLAYAHSNEEHVHLDEICKAAVILIQFIDRWCGLERA